jgi:centromeric protein E
MGGVLIILCVVTLPTLPKMFLFSVFAYGQTSSGKSHTMSGSGDHKGLIPRICDCLFHGIEQMKLEDKHFSVHASYYEIYNEKVS